jgi:hypothetical protein
MQDMDVPPLKFADGPITSARLADDIVLLIKNVAYNNFSLDEIRRNSRMAFDLINKYKLQQTKKEASDGAQTQAE